MKLRDGVVMAVVVTGGAATHGVAIATRSSEAPPTARPLAVPAAQPSIQEVNDRFVRQIPQQIAAQENRPSHLVFKNIKIEWLKSVPARQLLEIMNGGYARALGVRCTHCHVADDFASDEKRPKRAAREMAAMHRDINQRLAKMQNLEGAPEERFINCATCHRGSTDPREVPP
jgi:Photosynthetic reaction centre cytochrome C subunit